MNKLKLEKQQAVISALVEGNSIRSVERMTGIHRDTIMRLTVRIGHGCEHLLDETMRNLVCERVQLDELWCFVAKKQRRLTAQDDPSRVGDKWTFVAIDADTKLGRHHGRPDGIGDIEVEAVGPTARLAGLLAVAHAGITANLVPADCGPARKLGHYRAGDPHADQQRSGRLLLAGSGGRRPRRLPGGRQQADAREDGATVDGLRCRKWCQAQLYATLTPVKDARDE